VDVHELGLEFEQAQVNGRLRSEHFASGNAEEQRVMDTLVDMLEYLEDVQNVYHNAG
jgi:transcriptional/translational regulatory protein YebC/TACO1